MIRKGSERVNPIVESFARNVLEQSNARRLTQADIDRLGLVPFPFIGGPCDGDTMLGGEEFARRCHESAGRKFDRTNPNGHGPACFCPSGIVHQYAADYDRCCYRYVGPVGILQEREGAA